MEWYIGRRGSGKTTHLLKLASRYHCDIIVADQNRAHTIDLMARELKLRSPGLFTINDVMSGKMRGRTNPVIFDDVQDCLQMMVLGQQLRGGVLGLSDTDIAYGVKVTTDELDI